MCPNNAWQIPPCPERRPLLCLAGIPAQISCAGTLVPWVTTAPAAIAPSPMSQPCPSTVAFIPMSAPFRWLRGRWHHVPQISSSQDARYRAGLMDAGGNPVHPSVSTSDKHLHQSAIPHCQILVVITEYSLPVSTAFSAIKQFFPHQGVFPSTVFMIAIVNMYMFTIRVQR